jgi:PPIC-type peptidyl-prolyl cis-trans isomerase-like protein
MRHRSLLALVASVSLPLLTACQGLKEALTAHVDVVSRAESQELSVTRVADLLGKAKLPVPVSRDNVAIVTDIWVDYQLLGYAAAHGDSLRDKKTIDQALAGILQSMRLNQFMNGLVASFKGDSGSEAAYAAGKYDLLAARHILIGFPGQGATPPTPAQRDSVMKKAQSVRSQVTNENFESLVAKYSNDPSAKTNKGNMGVFPKGMMVPEFSNATAALKPGEISQPVESKFGFHIIQRLPFAEANKQQYGAQYSQRSLGVAESTYVAKLDSAAGVQLKSNAPTLAKDAVRDPAKHRKDNTALATYKGGELTVAEFLTWLDSFNPQQRIGQQIQQAPDTAVRGFVNNIVERELLMKKADSAKVAVPDSVLTQMYSQFGLLVTNVEQALGIEPKSLADSGKSAGERERIAANRIESYLDKIMAGAVQPVTVPPPLEAVLRDKYQWSINPSGLDRATENATKVRAQQDSAKAQNQPKSEVPLPGGPGGGQVAPTLPPTNPQSATPRPPASTKKP